VTLKFIKFKLIISNIYIYIYIWLKLHPSKLFNKIIVLYWYDGKVKISSRDFLKNHPCICASSIWLDLKSHRAPWPMKGWGHSWCPLASLWSLLKCPYMNWCLPVSPCDPHYSMVFFKRQLLASILFYFLK
jgi:hypothetical protein